MVAAQASIRTALRNTVLLMAKKEVRMGQGLSKVQPPAPLLGRASIRLYCVRTGKASPGKQWTGQSWLPKPLSKMHVLYGWEVRKQSCLWDGAGQ